MARKNTNATDTSSAIAYTAYNPNKQADYLYHPNIEISEQVSYQDEKGTQLVTRAQFVDWVTDKYGSYEAWLNKMTARDRKTHASYGPSGKRPWWGADEAAYHRVVRANQRRFDGQPPVDESTRSAADMSASSSSSSGGAAGGAGGLSNMGSMENWLKQHQTGVIVGFGAVILLVIASRKRR